MTSQSAVPVWKDGEIIDNPWQTMDADTGEWPQGTGPVIVPLARIADNPKIIRGANRQIGVHVPGGGDVAPLIPLLGQIAMIALEFANFADGRNYSTARLLREKHGFSGELRAVGDVLADQIPLMRRCGINAYAISNAPTLKSLLSGELAEVRRHYQPADSSGTSSEVPAGTRPWARRTV